MESQKVKSQGCLRIGILSVSMGHTDDPPVDE